MKFCRECNNMLYPKEDKVERRLLYACKVCDYWEPSNEYCISRNELKIEATQYTQVIYDLTRDPTLPRTNEVECPECGGHEAVFIQNQASLRSDESMKLLFCCTNDSCQHRWQA
eukprot:TRINITY_DN16524_c0_g1::TRINITY_DN16524_c0_g1_i1::g.1853::m.1853 TRINITY_DN16524_c0_g1::TRINITY_DN16524_c0_g1_i1::g.1853  ORF type:complete len:129 (+),score=-0.93,sp/Q6NLH0/RPB9A_ARATH/51.79/1e-35,RNA_POL_M_15KD/PF02150.11/4.2e-13,RNA_POL_M_15KD/PF02150.11/85,TFIIS_C/PF01096.13/6e+02,TFIIS_C/PF01096.13/3.4e+02,TFIIS_C/PF01096.13/7.3e-10,Zn_Tnp_IS1595/PF12760.2/4.9,Zn_Tnp_IS1595/PF12760.2/0.0071,DZR/PF12773.2/0.028,DZR/PF12773.2/12,Ogr_Delta/PF04606.7/1.8e+03,Ogr_Delta/PF04606.7/4.5e+03,Ogr_Delta